MKGRCFFKIIILCPDFLWYLFFPNLGAPTLNLGAPTLNLGAPTLNFDAPTQNFGASFPFYRVPL